MNPELSDYGFTSTEISVPHFFGTRGLPNGMENYIQLGEVTSGPPSFPLVATLNQTHSNDITVFDCPVEQGVLHPNEGDALVTNQPDVLLVVRTADCVPVLLVDHDAKVIGAIHAGWRGAVGGIVTRTIQTCVKRLGANLRHMHVVIGPSIGPCCYEVDAQVIEPLHRQYPDWQGVLQETKAGKGMLDLKRLLWHQILASGVLEYQVDRLEHCTRCCDDLFFSYRREGRVNGTMKSGIMLRS